MTACTHQLADGPLTCTRTDAHDPAATGGHSYVASWCPDRHTQEVGDE